MLQTRLTDPGGGARRVECGDGPIWVVAQRARVKQRARGAAGRRPEFAESTSIDATEAGRMKRPSSSGHSPADSALLKRVISSRAAATACVAVVVAAKLELLAAEHGRRDRRVEVSSGTAATTVAGSDTAATTVAGSGTAATAVAAWSARIASKERNGTGGGSKLDGAGAIGSGLEGRILRARSAQRPRAQPHRLANSYICSSSLSGRRKETGVVRRNGVTMGGRVPPGVPQLGESANRPLGRRRIDRAADGEPLPPVPSGQTKGGVMLNWEHNRADRGRSAKRAAPARS